MSKLYKTIQYGSFIFSLLMTFYYALPIEYQELIPQINKLTVGITAVGGTSLGAVMTLFQQKFMKLSDETTQKVDLLAKGFVEVNKQLEIVLKEVKQDLKAREESNMLVNNNNLKVDDLIKLVQTDLQIKASNPLINEEAKKLIEEALNGKEKEQVTTE